MNRKLVIGAVILAAAGYWGWQHYVNNAGNANKNAQAVLIKTTVVEKSDVPLALKQVGTVVANQSVAVRSRLDSQLMQVLFKDGDEVKEGDVMFLLDDRVVKAELQQAEANLVNYKAQFERSKQLAQKKYIAEADFDQSRANYDAQKAEVDRLKTQMGYMRITAPISGRTGTIQVTVGNTVKANDTQPLVTINQIKPIRVQFSLPQRYLDNVRQAMSQSEVMVSAKHDGSNDAAEGKMEYIDNLVDTASGTFAARALFANESELLWPGMFVNLDIVLGTEKDVISIPEVALQRGQNGDFAFVIEGDKAIKRNVVSTRVHEGLAIIESGLKEGEQVAIDGLMSLRDGSVIKIAESKAAETKE
ncbi:MAG: efflux RND transporter periplasmic adaptor subunit [Rickettsiales bacterium]|nr:efflux RND transporter periplasmic adaptor subunit [Rickettsiales bacterium]